MRKVVVLGLEDINCGESLFETDSTSGRRQGNEINKRYHVIPRMLRCTVIDKHCKQSPISDSPHVGTKVVQPVASPVSSNSVQNPNLKV